MALRIRLLGALGACLLVAAGAAQASGSIKLKNGSRLTGRATDYDEATQVLSFRVDGGEVRKLHLDELDGRSVYQVTRSSVPEDNGPGQLELANYARDIGLYAHSARHYRYAAAADPSLRQEVDVQLAEARSLAARWAMDNAKEAADEGDLREAEKWLTALIDKLPDEPLAGEARRILDGHYEKIRADQEAEVEAAKPGLLQKDLATAKKHYDSMRERNKKALTGGGSSGQRMRDWENAAESGERALRELDKRAKGYDDPETLATLEKYRGIVIDEIIQIRMSMASYYSTQSSYKKAADEVNRALALDPKNGDALAMRARVEENASRGGEGWWWSSRYR